MKNPAYWTDRNDSAFILWKILKDSFNIFLTKVNAHPVLCVFSLNPRMWLALSLQEFILKEKIKPLSVSVFFKTKQ